MRTYVSDNFPVSQLECQYFDVCKYYDGKKCKYGQHCGYGIKVGDKCVITMRDVLRHSLEDYMPEGNLKMQVWLLINGKK